MNDINKMSPIEKDIELYRCSKDPVYFSKHIKIINPVKGWIPLELFTFQKFVIKEFENSQNVFCLKSRQMGGTTLSVVYALWYALFKNDENVAYISSNFNISCVIYNNFLEMYDTLPDFIKLKIVNKNRDSVKFENGSSIIFKGCTVDCLRGTRNSLIILDDFAYYGNNKSREFWFTMYPTFSTSKIIINTGLDETNTLIRDIWNTGGDHWKRMPIPWYVHPERDKYWAKMIKTHNGEKTFRLEYLDFFRENNINDVVDHDDNILKIWRFFCLLKKSENREVMKI